MKLSPDQIALVKTVAQQFPQFVELVAAWRQYEMENGFLGTTENFGTSKGRVQLLTELQQKLRPV